MEKIHTLTSAGLLSNKRQVASEVFRQFFNSSFTQSWLYRGNITSYKHIRMLTRNNPEEQAYKIQEALNKLYGRYFESANVIVGYEETEDSNYRLLFSGTIVDGGETINVSEIIYPIDGTILN